MSSPSEVFRARLREVRRLKGWTQQQLADALTDAGVKLDASAITRLERGTRGLSLDDVLVIAAALGVSPLHLFVPLDNDEELNVAPSLTADALDVRAWVRGQRPLRETDDDRLFYAQTPERDWDVIALGAGGRFENREDFEGARARWERAILRQLASDGLIDWTRVSRSTGEVEDYDPDGDQWVKRGGQPSAEEQSASRPIPVEEALQQPVATAIVTAEGRVLVGRRNDGKPPWTFISGEVEPGESPADAAVREVKEETTLEVSAGEVIGERVHPRTGRTMIYLAASPVRGTEIFVGDEDELAEVRWVTLAEADELMAEYGMFEPVHEYLSREIGEG